jgi:Tol biopolymer transport system component
LFAIHPRTDRVSVDGSGTAGDGASSTPSINGDGSLVAFVSQSTNLVTGVGGTQIYVHNRQTNQIELASRDNDASVVTEGSGVSNAPTMSADGRFVAFVSLATNLLAPGAAVPAGQQIYVRDRQTGLTSLVSVDNFGVPNPGNGVSSAPSISADGRYVAFVSQATNLLAPGAGVPAGQQIYVRDRQTGLTSLVSVDNNVVPNPGTGVSSQPTISADGRFVAFTSIAPNLAPIPGASGSQIFLRDTQTNTTTLVSQDASSNAGNGASSAASINGNGGFVAFSSAADFSLGATGPVDIYIRAIP